MTSPAPRGFIALAAAGTVAAVALLVRLAVFAGYAEPPFAWSAAPWSAFMTHHACSTAYWLAATRITRAPDVWDIAISSLDQDPATGRLIPRTIGAFPVDPYEYPPTFLLAPRALAAVTPDYVAFRHVWLLLNAVLVIAGMAVIAREMDAATGRRTLWLLPLAIVPLTTLYPLQMGNAQMLYIVAAMLGMAAFARRRHALGGLLLAFTIVGKMFPGILILYLALRRAGAPSPGPARGPSCSCWPRSPRWAGRRFPTSCITCRGSGAARRSRCCARRSPPPTTCRSRAWS